jgi:PEP-CTERM motif
MILRTILLLLALAGVAPAWEFTYSSTTATEPFWFRPEEDLSGVPILGLSRYRSQSFVAPTTAFYTLTSIAAGGWDNFIVLYQGSFNAFAPLTNAIAANDDFVSTGRARIATNLVGGTTYHLVTTGYWLLESGAFTNTISNTPEPATWLLMAFGCGVLMLRRQLMPQPAIAVGSGPRSPQDRRSPGHPSARV